MRCTWIIFAPKGYIIQLNWLAFELENTRSYSCYDYVQIFDDITTNEEIGKYCGSTRPPDVTSSTNVLTIKFTTDFSQNYGGFELSYKFVNASNCEKFK